MKFTLKNACFLLGVSLLTTISCKNEVDKNANFQDKGAKLGSVESIDFSKYRANIKDNSIASEYEIRDGITHFRSPQDFAEVAKDINSFEKKFVSANPNFVSLKKAFVKASSELDKATSPEFFLRTTIAYNNVIQLKDSAYVAKTSGPLTAFLNSDGAIYIGKILYYLQGNDEYAILNGDLSEIKNIQAGRINSLTTVKVSTSNIKSNEARARRAGPCPSTSLKGDFKTYNDRWGFGNAHDYYYSFWTGNYDASNQELWWDYDYVYSDGWTEKKNFWGNWYSFATNNELKVNYFADAVNYNTFTSVATDEPNYTTTNTNTNGISDTHLIASRIVPYARVTEVVVIITERGGYYTSPELLGAYAFYKCQ